MHTEAHTPVEHERARGKLLPWIAAERAFRAIVLLLVGIALVTHPNANWAEEVTRFGEKLGLDPSSNWFHKLIENIERIGPGRDVFFGVIALAYGALEGAEAYGLWRRRRWGEWLTVIATSLLLIPEIWELSKGISPLKLGALVANIAIVAYLLWRMRR